MLTETHIGWVLQGVYDWLESKIAQREEKIEGGHSLYFLLMMAKLVLFRI